MANARMAIGSLFGAVAGVGTTVTSGLNVITKSAGMLEALVDEAAADQKRNIRLNSIDSTAKALETKARERQERKEEIAKYLGADTQRAASYDKFYNEMAAALEEMEAVDSSK